MGETDMKEINDIMLQGETPNRYPLHKFNGHDAERM